LLVILKEESFTIGNTEQEGNGGALKGESLHKIRGGTMHRVKGLKTTPILDVEVGGSEAKDRLTKKVK